MKRIEVALIVAWCALGLFSTWNMLANHQEMGTGYLAGAIATLALSVSGVWWMWHLGRVRASNADAVRKWAPYIVQECIAQLEANRLGAGDQVAVVDDGDPDG